MVFADIWLAVTCLAQSPLVWTPAILVLAYVAARVASYLYHR